MRRRQRGFLLNPYRFAGTVQSGAFGADGVGDVTLVGASTATAVASADGAGTLTFLGSTVQTASGAFSSDGVGAVSIVGASTASGAASSDGVSVGTFSTEAAALVVDAADFDGTNDGLTRLSNFTGAANSKQGILSFWHKGDVNPTVQHSLLASRFSDTTACIECSWVNGPSFGFAAGQYYLVSINADPSNPAFGMHTAASFTSGTWRHVLCSWDLLAGTRHLYITDVSSLTLDFSANISVTYADVADWNAGTNAGSVRMDGGFAEFYFAPGQFLDFSVQGNRRKFITAGGKPANLGATGVTPTGSAPLIYLHLDDGETANNFATNRVGSGNFTVEGALTTYATSPSD